MLSHSYKQELYKVLVGTSRECVTHFSYAASGSSVGAVTHYRHSKMLCVTKYSSSSFFSLGDLFSVSWPK